MRYAKTQAGQQAFKERSPLLSARQRAAFLMFDGVKPLDTVLQAVAGLGVTAADIEHLVAQGFLEPSGAVARAPGQPAAAPSQTPDVAGESVAVGEPASAGANAPAAGPAGLRTPGQRYQDAYPLAVKLVSGLGLRGFRLNLAVEAASGYDELLALFPKIQDAVGVRETMALEAALKG